MLSRLFGGVRAAPFRTSKFFKPKLLQHIRYDSFSTTSTIDLGERERIDFDVVIVGGGPAGLATAIRLKQLASKHNKEIDVCLLEKGAEVGSHIISGNVFNPIALNELFPDWKERGAPLIQPVTEEKFWFMSKSSKISAPFIPKMMRNDGNYVISLGDLCRWLAEQAENEYDVSIFPGFAASEALFNEQNQVIGVATQDVGLLKDGTPGPNFERGSEIRGRQIILAEGCRGSISEEIMKHYNLRKNCDDQIYGIGFKEVWEISPNKSKPGLVIHAMGYPIPSETYGGSYIYHTHENQVLLGCIIGLEYRNPYLNPYLEFQKLKKHPIIAELLTDGECLSYGARAINEGGYQSIPKLSFPGGLLVGCSAGFVNVPKVKGSHYAMKSGIIAAENIFANVIKQKENEEKNNIEIGMNNIEISEYERHMSESYIFKELYQARNVKPSFNFGQLGGLLHSAFTTVISRGKEPWTLRNKYNCADRTLPKKDCQEIKYEKADNILTFDILTNLQRTNTYHEDHEPSHLKIKPELQHIADNDSFEEFGGPESRFCPAKVYEFVESNEVPGKMELVINSQNCIHCKTCSIKTPKEYINWTVPQGGSGPGYASM